MENPSCFVSYSHDTAAHKDWVRSLAVQLQSHGVEVKLDQWDLRPGADLLNYMETSIRESDFVLLICSPMFAAKANAGRGGVGYEKAIVSAEVFEDSRSEKFIPVLRSGTSGTSLPSYIKSRLYVDATDDERFEAVLEDLLRVLHGKPSFSRPPLGPIPDLGLAPASPAATGVRASSSAPFEVQAFKKVFEFAYGGRGLNLSSRSEAMAWAERWIREGRSLGDLERFRRLFDFAYGGKGLNLPSRQEAVAFAERLLDVDDRKFEDFKEAFDFAYSSIGMNLSRPDAARWALDKTIGNGSIV